MSTTRQDLHHLIDELPEVEVELLAQFAHRLRQEKPTRRRAAKREWIAHFVAKLPAGRQVAAWDDLHWLFGEPTVTPTTDEAEDLAQARGEEDTPWNPAHSGR